MIAIDRVSDIFQYTAAAGFVYEGVIHFQVIKQLECLPGYLLLPVAAYTTDKENIFCLFIFLPAKVDGLLCINI